MAKKKEKEELENDFFGELSKNVGADLLDDLSNCLGFIDTGVLSLNYISSGLFIGGGIPQGSIVEVSGHSATGKSLFGTNLLRGCQTAKGISCFHDAEHAISKNFAIRASHVDPKKLIVSTSETLQGSFNKIHKIIRYIRDEKKVPLETPVAVVYDSIAASPSQKEYQQVQYDSEELSEAKLRECGFVQTPAERARICSLELRKLMPVVKQKNITVLFVNQLRATIGGGLYGPSETEAGGGAALKYYASTRMRMYSSKQLKDENGRTIGMSVMVKNTKSRFTHAHQVVTGLKLFFDNGIDPLGGLLQLQMNIGRVSSPSKGNYVIDGKYTFDGNPYKFKATKEANTIPIEALLENPKVVDAETPEQIQYYIDMFGEANKVANSNLTEEDIKNSEDVD